MINKDRIKSYLVIGGVVIIILLIILILPLGKKGTSTQTTTPSPTSVSQLITPTRILIPTIIPTNGPSPTLIPLRFTGADMSQDLPPDVKLFSVQKTELRRKAPLDLPFGVLSFDYGNDKFVLSLKDPKDQSKIAFGTWLNQTYPAIPIDQFAIQ